MLREWFGLWFADGMNLEIIAAFIMFAGMGMLVAYRAVKNKVGNILVFLIPCIVIITCEVRFNNNHGLAGMLPLIVGGYTTLFLCGAVIWKVIILIKAKH